MKWFNLGGIVKEIKKIRWPNRIDMVTNSVQTVIIIVFFALFFLLCELVISLLLRAIGVIA